MPTTESVNKLSKSVEKFVLKILIEHFNLDIDVDTVNEAKIMSWLKYQIGVYQMLEHIPNKPPFSRYLDIYGQKSSKLL